MQLSTSYFATTTPAQVDFLYGLAAEFKGRIKVKKVETPHSNQVIIETDSQQLRDYVYFELNRFRENAKELQRTLTKVPLTPGDDGEPTKRGPGCIACGDCGCDPEVNWENGQQIDPCECEGCWDRRRVDIAHECAAIDVAAGTIPDTRLAYAARVARDLIEDLRERRQMPDHGCLKEVYDLLDEALSRPVASGMEANQ